MAEDSGGILLVEDDPNDAELIVHAFKRSSLTGALHVVRDGAEALDYIFCRGEYARRAGQRPPRVVLLDLKLPKVDGLEVLRSIRSEPRTSTVPVVLLTSSSQERDIVAGYGLGANSYIVKPVDFGRLSETMRIIGMYWLMINQPPPLT